MTKHTEPHNIIINLDLMAALKSGDRIGAPNKNGVFKINGWRNDNDSITIQVVNIKSVFHAALSDPSLVTKDTFDKSVAAYNGLNKILANYQEKGNKDNQSKSLREALYDIDKLITSAQAKLANLPSSGNNITLAKNAIKYLNSLDIASNNVRFNGHFKNELDTFLGRYLRQEHRFNDDHIVESFHAHLTFNKNKMHDGITIAQAKALLKSYHDIRREILAILRKESSGTERELKNLLNREKSKGYSNETWIGYEFKSANKSDEERIRLARKSIKFGRGNCYEKSAIVATHMLEATRGSKSIFWVACISYDHCFAIVADKNLLTAREIETKPAYEWTGDAVIVDGWTGDYYSASNIRKRAGLFSFHKNIARRGIVQNFVDIKSKGNSSQAEFPDSDDEIFEIMGAAVEEDAKNAILVRESLSWPPSFDPSFRLSVAKFKNSYYKNAMESINPRVLARISAQPDLLESQIIMCIEGNQV
jgi:hypothetical protein